MELAASLHRLFSGHPTDSRGRPRKHILFVCTESLQRAPTAAKLFRHSREYEARFCGTNPLAPNAVTQELIDWADIIFVMSEEEDGHQSFLERFFNTHGKVIHDLDIPKIYLRGERELKQLLRSRVSAFIDLDV